MNTHIEVWTTFRLIGLSIWEWLPAPENSIDYPLDLVQIVYWDWVHEGFAGKSIQADCAYQEMAHVSMINNEDLIISNMVGKSKLGAHEFGHNYSCDHCDARLFADDTWSLMHTGALEKLLQSERSE